MGRRNPNLDWIKKVLADPGPTREEPYIVAVVDNGDAPRAHLVPDISLSCDTMPDLDTDLAEDAVEK